MNNLINSISNINYPKNLLDIKIIVEEDDFQTIKALSLIDMNGCFDVLKVPSSFPRTKPKALNYSLPFIKGEYVVVYDAEDTPEPDQLIKAINKFNELPNNFVCLQAKLKIISPKKNIISKLLSIEYDFWFEIFLTSLSNLNLLVPLGGTSNHLKVDILKKIGGWDAYNVTEDAELGLRLYLNGYKTSILDSKTFEKTNVNIESWLSQRIRWIKGFFLTYFVYLRQKKVSISFKEKYAIHQVLGLSSFSFILLPILIGVNLLSTAYESNLSYIYNFNFIFLVLFYLFQGLTTLRFNQHYKKINVRTVLTFCLYPLYFILHSIAAYCSIYELITQPYKWNKTDHDF